MALEESGIRLVVKGGPQASKQLKAFEKATNSVDKAINKVSSKKLTDMGGKHLANLGTKALSSSKYLGQLSGSLGKLATTAPQAAIAIGAVVAAIAAATAATKVFVATAQRGAEVQGVANAFGGMTGSILDSTNALENLRATTRGTVADVDLMRLANRALTGQSDEFRKVLLSAGEDGELALGKLIDGTNRLAAATGRSAQQTQTRIIDALRLQSTLRIDDFVGTINQTEANEAYAKSLGVAASALTTEQEKAAFAFQALQQLEGVTESLGDRTSVLEDLRAPATFLANTLDKLAYAVLPALAPVTDMVASLFRKLGTVTNFVLVAVKTTALYMRSLIDLFREIGSFIQNVIMNFTTLGFTIRAVAAVAPYLVAAFQLVIEFMTEIVNTIGSVLAIVNSVLGKFGVETQKTIGNIIESLAFNLAKGGALIIGGFAAGILRGGTFVVDAVTAIARIVADFLVGFSPPKKGPLKDIDKGGYNVARTWAEGFAKGFVKPVEVVTREVNERLGAIGKLGATQVAGRLAQLDAAIKPFANQLAIIKSDFEAITGFADPALSAINRQIDRILKAGKVDISRLRTLDKQAEKLKDLKSLEQDRVDEAEIQLAIAKARQAQERALLGIQQDRVGAVQAEEAALKGGAGAIAKTVEDAKAPKVAAARGGAAAETMEEFGAGALTLGEAPELISSEAIDRAKEVLARGWQEGLDEAGFTEAMSEFTGSTAELTTELGRIAEADPVGKLTEKFEGLGTILDDPLGSLKTAFDNTMGVLPTAAIGALAAIKNSFNTSFESIGNVIDTVLGGISSTLSVLGTTISGPLMALQTIFITAFAPIQALLTSIFGGGEEGGGATSVLNTALTNFQKFINGLIGAIILGRSLITSSFNVLKGVLSTFADVGIGDALSGLRQNLERQLLDPFIAVINAIVDSIDNIMPDEVVIDWGSLDIPIIDPAALLRGELGFLTVDLGKTTLDLPNTPFRDALSAVAGARGFVNQRGPMLVGERGPELLQTRQPATVFPNSVSRSIMDMLPASGMPLSIGHMGNTSNANYNTDNRSISNTFNMQSAQDAALVQREQIAFLNI